MKYRTCRTSNPLPFAVVAFALSVFAFVLALSNHLGGEPTEPAEAASYEVQHKTEAPLEPLPEPAEEPTTEEPTAEAAAYTIEDLEHLALVIYQEAGGDACSDVTRMAVGTVVMNRVADDHFPDTIEGVLTQRAQYGRLYWTGLEWPERASQPGEAHAVQRARDCAARILEGERTLPEDVVYQAEFKQGTEVVAFLDGMYFCR